MSHAAAAQARRGVAPLGLWLALAVIGVGWGMTQFLAKVGMQGGYHAVGIAFWQALVGSVAMAGALVATGRRLPLTRRHAVFYLVCGILGTALPSSLSLTSIQHLPVGVQALVLSTVPMMTLLMAIPAGIDRPEPRRLLGLALGFGGVALLVLPRSSLPDPALALWILLPIAVAASYAAENVVIGRFQPRDTDALQTMCGLIWAAALLLAPLQLLPGVAPRPERLGPEEAALIANGVLNISAYLGLVWLIGRGGAVFASQVSYFVTATGILSGMVFLGERHSGFVWAAVALLFAGLALVRPRDAGRR